MKHSKQYLFSFILIALFTLPASLALATADGPDFWAIRNVKASDSLNIRANPGMKGPIIGKIPHNAKQVENMAEFYPSQGFEFGPVTWCKIKYKKIEGWVACKFLEESDYYEK